MNTAQSLAAVSAPFAKHGEEIAPSLARTSASGMGTHPTRKPPTREPSAVE